jgi:hypothetical protein
LLSPLLVTLHSGKNIRKRPVCPRISRISPVQRKLVQHPKDWPWSRWSFYAHGEGMIAIEVRGATKQQTKTRTLKLQGCGTQLHFRALI